MGAFVSALKESLEVFSRNPKFIVPKLVVALVYSVLIVLSADLLEKALNEPSLALALQAFVLIVVLVFAGILDALVGAMYPLMVVDVRSGRRVLLASAAKGALAKAGKVLPTVILIELFFLAVVTIVSMPLALVLVVQEIYAVVFTVFYVVFLLAVVFFFYQLYPVLVFENASIIGSLKRSVEVSLLHSGAVLKAIALSFFLSAVSAGLAFSIEFFPQAEGTPLFWAVFILIRFLTAYVYAYLYVLSPVFYFEFVQERAKSGGASK